MNSPEDPDQARSPSSGERKVTGTDEERRAWAEWEAAEEARLDELRSTAVEEMVEWFYFHFEDPQNETPRDDGEFVFVWGGPFDAGEVLYEQFTGEYEDEWIELAKGEVEADGIIEWAPTSRGDFFYHPAENENSSSAITHITREGLLTSLAALKSQLADLETAPAAIGHNRPPDPIDAPPYTEEEKSELNDLLETTEAELARSSPDLSHLRWMSSKIGNFAEKAIRYAGQKTDLAIDETIKKGVPIVVAYLTFGQNLQNFIDSVMAYFGL